MEESYESVDQGRQVDSEHESEVDGVGLRLVPQPNEVRFVAGGEVSACKSRREENGMQELTTVRIRSVKNFITFFHAALRKMDLIFRPPQRRQLRPVQPLRLTAAAFVQASFGLRRASTPPCNAMRWLLPVCHQHMSFMFRPFSGPQHLHEKPCNGCFLCDIST